VSWPGAQRRYQAPYENSESNHRQKGERAAGSGQIKIDGRHIGVESARRFRLWSGWAELGRLGKP